MFRHCKIGQSSLLSDKYRSFEFEGNVAILTCASVSSSEPILFILSFSNCAISSCKPNSLSRAAATLLMVTSSCVGPTPPEVIITSTSLCSLLISATISSWSSEQTTTFESMTFCSYRALAAVCVLVSEIIPFRISSPIINKPTVR